MFVCWCSILRWSLFKLGYGSYLVNGNGRCSKRNILKHRGLRNWQKAKILTEKSIEINELLVNDLKHNERTKTFKIRFVYRPCLQGHWTTSICTLICCISNKWPIKQHLFYLTSVLVIFLNSNHDFTIGKSWPFQTQHVAIL